MNLNINKHNNEIADALQGKLCSIYIAAIDYISLKTSFLTNLLTFMYQIL